MRLALIVIALGCLVTAGCTSAEDQAQTVEAPVVLEGAAPFTCGPLDEGTWARTESPAGAADVVSLAANEDAVVLASVGPDGLVVHSTTNGLEWREGPVRPDVEGLQLGVAGGPRGFVVVADPDDGAAPNPPVVLFSADGATWEELDHVDLPRQEVSWSTDVLAGSDGFVVVGRAADGALVWFSPDGRTWIETDSPWTETDPPSHPTALTASDTGWLALSGLWSGNQAWTSPDGLLWTETETEDPPPDHAISSYLGTAPLVSIGDTLVLAVPGAADDSRWPHTPTVWVSTDDGVSWSEHLVWSGSDANGFAVADLEVTDLGLTLAGTQDTVGEESEGFLHLSPDGTTWQHCWTSPLTVEEIVRFGEGVVLFDSEFGDIHVWSES